MRLVNFGVTLPKLMSKYYVMHLFFICVHYARVLFTSQCYDIG